MIAETMRAEYELNKNTIRHLGDILVALGTVLLVLMILFPRPFLISGPAIYTALLLTSAAMTAVVLGTRPVRLLSKPAPLLVIDDAGIHPLAYGLPTLAWDKIRRISIKYRVITTGGQPARQSFLCVDFHELQSAAELHEHVRRRPRLSGHLLLAPGRICIDFAPMRPSIDDACRAIEQICRTRKQAAQPVPVLNLELPGKELQVVVTPAA